MAPCRQVLMWSVPSIAVILGIYWLKKKRELAKSDSGGRVRIKTLKEELAEALNDESEAMRASPLRTPGQSIIIRSAPIDIISNGSGSHRSSPMDFTDEDINLEIEKIVKKKSLENEKRMSNNFGKQIVLVSSSVGKSPLITEELTPQKNPSHNLDLKEQNSDIDIFPLTTDMVDENNMTSTEYISDEFEAESSQHNSIILESTESKANTMDDSTVPEAENINTNTIAGTGESNVESSSRFSPEQTRRISERDSANHSPVDPMLASPMCHFSDNHSEGSSDSGKGCSEAASPPPTNLNMIPPDKLLRIHQFLIPHHLVGLLIGKGGSFVKLIKSTTGANVYVKKLPEVMNISMTEKICAIEGTQSAIEAALELIKDKFPKKLLNQISLQEISAELHQRITPIVPDYLQLRLVESVNNDTILTCIVTAGHFFLQQPLHPTFPSLHVLHRLMATTYQNPDVPSMPRPVKVGSICAAPTENNWYRAEVISTSEEDDTSVVKLVDFGGYLTVDNDQLKQIHADFMTLPFQATEALLAFVKPAKNAVDWCEEALRIMAGLTAGQMLHAQVVGYNEDMVPLVNLYLTLNPQQVIFLNRELVDRGLAEWEIPPDS